MATATPSTSSSISIAQAELLRSLEPLAKVARSKSRPILSNIHIWADGPGIRLHAYSGDSFVHLSDFVYCDSHNPGTPDTSPAHPPRDFNILVHAERFAALIRSLSPPKAETNPRPLIITIERGETNRLTVQGPRSVSHLPITDPSEFPEYPSIESGDVDISGIGSDGSTSHLRKIARFPAYALRDALVRTQDSVDENSNRYALSGVLIEIDPQLLDIYVVATDGRHLVTCRLPEFAKPELEGISGDAFSGSTDSQGRVRLIVPQSSAKLLTGGKSLPSLTDSSVEESSQEVTIYGASNAIAFEWGERTLITPLVEGRFPAWRDVSSHVDYSRSDSHTITIRPADFAAAIKQAQTFVDDDHRYVVLEIPGDDGGMFGSDNEMVVASSASQLGNHSAAIPCEREGGSGGVKVAVDPKYIGTMLREAEKEVVLSINGKMNAGGYSDEAMLVRCELDGYEVLVMPINAGGK